jgi:hypothetical protein
MIAKLFLKQSYKLSCFCFLQKQKLNLMIMKLILKFMLPILLIVATAIISCSKDPGNYPTSLSSPPPPPLPIIDTLSGKEFNFSGLRWDYWLDDFDELYVSIENRPDLFSRDRAVEISVKSITDSTWITAQKDPIISSQYVYSIYLGRLYLFPYPFIYRSSGNTQLAGSLVSLKVRFY